MWDLSLSEEAVKAPLHSCPRGWGLLSSTVPGTTNCQTNGKTSLKPGTHSPFWKHLTVVKEKGQDWFEGLHWEARSPNHALSEAAAFFRGPHCLVEPPPRGPWRTSAFGGAFGTRQEASFPSLTTQLSQWRLPSWGMESGWRGLCVGVRELKRQPQLGGGTLVLPSYNCGKNTKPRSMWSTSQRDKIMSIFLRALMKLMSKTFLIAFRSIYSTECN